MTDRISDEQLDALIDFAQQDLHEASWKALSWCRLSAFQELRERREAEQEDK